ncbi:anti-sigma factor [Burkholderia sp. 22PA0099]|uniref:anti-sigma factor family protein n=1 Tax=Burkholderia sp. 22PA0099 TaxID=3237372 RepID=UPI0039C41B65
MNIPPDDHDLQAYVDGRLDAPSRAAVERWLDHHPQRAEQMRQWRRDAQALRAALDGLPLPPPTRELDPALLRANRHARLRMRGAIAAALFLCVGLGGGAGWMMRGWQIDSGPVLAQNANGNNGALLPASATIKPMGDALAAYRLVVDRSAQVDVVTHQPADLQAWLDRSVGSAIRLPDLSKAGFKPVGGRLFATEDGPSAMVLYQDDTGHAVSFYVRPPGGSERVLLKNGSRRDGALLAQYGSHQGYNYALIAPTHGVDDAALGSALAVVRG